MMPITTPSIIGNILGADAKAMANALVSVSMPAVALSKQSPVRVLCGSNPLVRTGVRPK